VKPDKPTWEFYFFGIMLGLALCFMPALIGLVFALAMMGR
jgi:hypothetical protein